MLEKQSDMAGALRKYLELHKELPKESLVAIACTGPSVLADLGLYVAASMGAMRQ